MAKHTHQYQRRVLGKNYVVYVCVAPDCPKDNHYVPEALIVGKLNICNRCKKNKHTIKKDSSGAVLHKPHCAACTMEPRNPALRRKGAKVKPVEKEVLPDLVNTLLGDILDK